ncbi:MAG: SDR family oxidoreductase [Chthoniobacterales bacterium]
MKFFEGCTALITGASSGLGTEFAYQLAPYADTLVLVARRNDRLESLRAELTALHPRLSVFIYMADIAKEEQLLALKEWLENQDIVIDFLINNAGLGDRGKFEDGEWTRIQAMLDVNIVALTHLTHLLLPTMHSSGRGAILNVSSIASLLPLPRSGVYAATKAYVTSLSEALRIELRGTGISVTALCPGPIETEFFTVASRGDEPDYSARSEAGEIFLVSPEEVVRAGLRAVALDKARVVPGPIVCLAMAATVLVPLFILRKILQYRFDSGK